MLWIKTNPEGQYSAVSPDNVASVFPLLVDIKFTQDIIVAQKILGFNEQSTVSLRAMVPCTGIYHQSGVFVYGITLWNPLTQTSEAIGEVDIENPFEKPWNQMSGYHPKELYFSRDNSLIHGFWYPTNHNLGMVLDSTRQMSEVLQTRISTENFVLLYQLITKACTNTSNAVHMHRRMERMGRLGITH